jgi:hypothetical protein
LREVALSSRGTEPRLFHPQRDVAEKYRVPLSLAAHLFHELEREGILRPIRGAGTLLEGLNGTRKPVLRGVVAIASSLTQFMGQQDYRMFQMRLGRELQKREFAAAETFYEAGETADDLAERLQGCHPDRVIWYSPRKLSREVALRLHDRGIPIIGVNDNGYPGIRCQYEIRREAALAEIVGAWKKQAMTSVTVAVGATRSAVDDERVSRTVDALDMGVKFVSLGSRTVRQFIGCLTKGLRVGIVMMNSVASLMATEEPESFDRLTKYSRVALLDGPVSIPAARMTNATVDLVTVDWQAVAKRIVDDLTTRRPGALEQPCVFEATAQCGVPLSRFSQRL